MSIQRSVLLLVVALSVVLLLTAIIFERTPPSTTPAAVDVTQSGSSPMKQENARARERYYLIGREFWRDGEYAKAEEMFRLALLHQRRDAVTLRLLGMSVFAQARFDEAEQLFQQLVRLKPKQPSAYLSLAVSQLSQGKTGDAEQAARDGLKHATGEQAGWLYFVLACAAADAQQDAEATGYFNQAHELLGEHVTDFAAANWAKSLQRLDAFHGLVKADPNARVEALPPALPDLGDISND